MNGNPNQGNNRKENQMTNATTKTTSMAILIALGLALTAWSAEPPRPEPQTGVAWPAVQPMYSWRGIGGTGVFPARGLVSEFWDVPEGAALPATPKELDKLCLPAGAKPGTRKNIVWRTTLPHWGHNAPVVVGRKVFLLSAEGWKSDCPELVCLDAEKGDILWQRPVDHLDAWPADKAAEARAWRTKEHARWRKGMEWWHRLYWNSEKNSWAEFTPEQVAPIAEAAKKDGVTLKPAYVDRPDGTKVVQRPGGVSGGFRGRYGLTGRNVSVDGQDDVYSTCNKNRYYWYPGWSSEGPFFGSTMGSVVSDGRFVYAVTALDAAVCYDLEGKRQWVTDLDGKHVLNYPASAPGYIANHMSSPVLADGVLVYHHTDSACTYGLDAATGRIRWKSDPRPGGGGHMTPGSTPVVMRLGATTVVIPGNGAVVRVADGKVLGAVGGGSSYNSWTAAGDVLYAQTGKAVRAVRLALDGDTLTQRVLWTTPEDLRTGIQDTSLTVTDGKVYGGSWGKVNSVGYAALDAATGAIALRSGGQAGSWNTSVGFGLDKVVLRAGVDHNWSNYTIHEAPGLKRLGQGFLAAPPLTEDLRARHIAAFGTDTINWGAAGITCWGNRIFIRSNDYLWCIGDPAQPFVAPETVSKATP